MAALYVQGAVYIPTKVQFFMEQGTGVEPFLVQIHPPLTFSDYFAQLIWSKRCAGFLAWKRKKPAPERSHWPFPKPVFACFRVFRAISAPKARKLPDLSGRQIRQSIWLRRRDLNPLPSGKRTYHRLLSLLVFCRKPLKTLVFCIPASRLLTSLNAFWSLFIPQIFHKFMLEYGEN